MENLRRIKELLQEVDNLLEKDPNNPLLQRLSGPIGSWLNNPKIKRIDVVPPTGTGTVHFVKKPCDSEKSSSD